MRHLPHKLKTAMRSRRAGSLMPAIVVALIVVLAGTALVLDRLWLDNSKTELRAVAESAALAAGRELASDALLQKEFNADAYLMKARLAAARIAAENRVAGDTVILKTERDELTEEARLKTRWGRMSTIFHKSTQNKVAEIDAKIAVLNSEISAIEMRGIAE